MVYSNQQAKRNDTISYLLYSTVIYSSTLKVIYAFIVIYDLEVKIFDIVVIYFNTNVLKNVIIYIQQLHILDDGTGYTCRLKKALYGLHSTLKWWYDTIVPMFKEYNFKTFISDIYYFINKDKNIFFCLYIDDIIVTAPTNALIV